MNLASLFCDEYGLKPVFRSVEGDFSIKDIYSIFPTEVTTALARKLVFCLVENDVAGLSGYLRLLLSNAVPLMLNAAIPNSQLYTLLLAYRPNYVWVSKKREHEFVSATCLLEFSGYCLLRLDSPNHIIHDDLALLLPTSGSTGSPKFVRLSKNNIVSNAKSIAHYLELNPAERPITTLPPSYSYGLSILHSHLFVGATVLVTNLTFFDRGFWDFVRDERVTSLAGVPYHYEMLKKLRFFKINLPDLRTMTQAGGRLDPALTLEFSEYCTKHQKRFFTMYGQAEATARMAYLPYECAISKVGSIGQAIPGGRFWLENSQGVVIDGVRVGGELIYAGENVSLGYASSSDDLKKGDENFGVLHTGDLAMRDADGYYYIVGRLKRFIKLFGNRINLTEVESFLTANGVEAACTGVDDRLEIYTTLQVSEPAIEIKKKVATFLNVALQGLVVFSVRSIPRNEAGKILYSELNPKLGLQIA